MYFSLRWKDGWGIAANAQINVASSALPSGPTRCLAASTGSAAIPESEAPWRCPEFKHADSLFTEKSRTP